MTLVHLDGGALDGGEFHLIAPTLPLVLRLAPIDAPMQGVIEMDGRPWFLVGADFNDEWPEQVTYAFSPRRTTGPIVVYEHREHR